MQILFTKAKLPIFHNIPNVNGRIQKNRRFDADQYPGYERRFCGGDDPDGAGALGYDL
jgi:hypothetical protein